MIDGDLSFALKPGVIHTWLVDIDDPLPGMQDLEKLLSADEIERSKNYRFAQDSLRFIIRRGILRVLISKYTSLNLEEIVYSNSSYGKLFLPYQKLHFSTSHSQNKIAYAFSSQADIGVDIEQVKPLSNPAKLANSWFSDAEIEGLSRLDAREYLQGYYHVWTQKEAFIKARGEGLVFPLTDFSVSVNSHQPGRLLSIKDEDALGWIMMTFIPDPGWRMAVCVQASRAPKVKQNKTTLKEFLFNFFQFR